MPRVSVRRMLALTVYTVFVTSLVMLALHMHQPNALFRIENDAAHTYVRNKDFEDITELAITATDSREELAIVNVSELASSTLRRRGLPWYLRPDGFRPSPEYPIEDIWPGAGHGDRIENQLLIPKRSLRGEHLKKIYLPNGLGSWQLKRGQKVFLEQKCPVDNCWLTDKREDAATADAIMFKGTFIYYSVILYASL